MKTRALGLCLVTVSLLLGGCAGEVTASPDQAEAAARAQKPAATPPGCSGGVCLATADQAKLDDAKAKLAACVPIQPDDAPTGDPSGLRIAEVAVGAWDAATDLDGIGPGGGNDVLVRITLVNVSPHGNYAYPGVLLSGAGVSPENGDWRYGMLPCSSTVMSFRVPKSAKSTTLTAHVANSFGKELLASVSFRLEP